MAFGGPRINHQLNWWLLTKNSFIYIAPKDERDDTIKIQLSDYENGISYEYTIPLIFAGNNEHSLDKFKENLSRLPNS